MGWWKTHLSARFKLKLRTQPQFNGVTVDFFPDSDPYRTWITIINLHWTNTTAPGVVSAGRPSRFPQEAILVPLEITLGGVPLEITLGPTCPVL